MCMGSQDAVVGMKPRVHGVLIGRWCLTKAARLLRDWIPGHIAIRQCTTGCPSHAYHEAGARKK